MPEATQTSRYYGVSVISKRDGQKSYRAYFRPSPKWPSVVLERCQNKKRINICTFKSEEEAASAVDQAHYNLFSDQPGGCPRPPNLPALLTPTICAALATKIDEWAALNGQLRKENATSKYRGVYKRSRSTFSTGISHPITNKLMYPLTDPNEELCAHAYDRHMLKWWGSGIIAKLNFPITSYLEDNDPEIAQIAKEIDEGGEPHGEYGPYKDRARLRAGTVVDPNQASTSASASASAPAARRRRPPVPATARAAPSNQATAPAALAATADVETDFHNSDDDNSDDDYESEYVDTEEEDTALFSRMNTVFEVLTKEEEYEILEWLEEQGIIYPFPRNLEDGGAEEELPDDPHGVLQHLAGPDWDIPPVHPEAQKLWRSEIKRTVENFENDVRKILDMLQEENEGYDPQNYKINGLFPEPTVYWLITKGYIDIEGNTLKNVPSYDKWINELTEKSEKEAADRAAASAAGVPFVPPPKPVVPEGVKPFFSDRYFHLPPGLEKLHLPYGELALLSLNNYYTCKTRREIDRKLKECQSVAGFCGPDGQLSMDKIGEAFDLLGQQCVEAIHEMFQKDELRDWFIIHSAALYRICGDAVSFIPKDMPLPPEPEPDWRQSPPPISGDETAADWAHLQDLSAQLQAALQKDNVPQTAVQEQPQQQQAQQQQQQAELAAGGAENLDLKIKIQEKQRSVLTPSLLSSAQARLAELQAQEQHPEPQQQEEKTSLATTPDDFGNPLEDSSCSQHAKHQEAQEQDPVQQGAEALSLFLQFDYSAWVDVFGGEDKLSELLNVATVEMTALATQLNLPALPLSAAAAAPAADAGVPSERIQPEVNTKEYTEAKKEEVLGAVEEEVEEEDFVQRWEHVAPGYAERMKRAQAEGYFKVIDSRILARQAQLKLAGSSAVCDALAVERSIGQTLKDLVQRKRCEEWNWKVGLAVQQNLNYWLTDILGESWKDITDAHPDGLVFGPHRRAPDLEDPLDIYGLYYDDERYTQAELSKLQLYEMHWKEAQVGAVGPSMNFIDALYRYWEPVILADPTFCGAPVKTQVPVPPKPSSSAPRPPPPSTATAAAGAAAAGAGETMVFNRNGHFDVKVLAEKDLDEDDVEYVMDRQLKVVNAGNKRRRDTVYL